MLTVLEFAIQTAQSAGEILQEHFRSQHLESHFKVDHTLVTAADIVADEYIRNTIHTRYPQDGILSEEAGTTWQGEKAIWIVDPLDGTTNYQWGLPLWGVSIARWVDGLPSLGVIHFPLLKETYAAQRGRGVTRNGVPLPKDEPKPLAFFACCSRTHRRYDITLPYKTRILGAVTYNMIQVALGNAALNLEVTPKLWDVAAGWPIVEESGGVVSVLAGESPIPLRPGTNYAQISFSTLAAGSEALLAEGKAGLRAKI